MRLTEALFFNFFWCRIFKFDINTIKEAIEYNILSTGSKTNHFQIVIIQVIFVVATFIIDIISNEFSLHIYCGEGI